MVTGSFRRSRHTGHKNSSWKMLAPAILLHEYRDTNTLQLNYNFTFSFTEFFPVSWFCVWVTSVKQVLLPYYIYIYIYIYIMVMFICKLKWFLYFIHSKDYESDPSSAHKPSAICLCLWLAAQCRLLWLAIIPADCSQQKCFSIGARAAPHSTYCESRLQFLSFIITNKV